MMIRYKPQIYPAFAGHARIARAVTIPVAGKAAWGQAFGANSFEL
jgi:hypothetical protein